MSSFTVTAAFSPDAPNYVSSPSDFEFIGFDTVSLSIGSTTPSPAILNGAHVTSAGILEGFGNHYLVIVANSVQVQAAFTSVTALLTGGTSHLYNTSAASFAANGGTIAVGTDTLTVPSGSSAWVWTTANTDFANAQVTTLTIAGGIAAVDGHGDFTDPEAWIDESGNIPPLQFQNVPSNVNYPLNGDGRYWFVVNAETPAGGTINFIGNPSAFVDSAAIQWSVVQAANDNSSLVLSYSTDGFTYTDTTIAPTTQLKSLQNGIILAPLVVSNVAVQQLYVKVAATGGSANASATQWEVACAITRNVTEHLTWDSPNPFNPINYNGKLMDFSIPTDTLANLRARIMTRLGFANQAANPPPGMTALVNDFIISAQKYLYKRYTQLHTSRKFRWKINPGQRFYSLEDSDQDTMRSNHETVPNPIMDPNRRIEWAGIQDSRNVWYPMIQGIPPQLYTMITKPWRPARYELRGCIEVYPAPDQTYFMWMEGHFGLLPFAADSDMTTIDAELVFLHALANAKSHYGQPDANNIEAQANAYRLELVAASHQTAHYIPGTIAVPPAVRPTLIQFDNNLTSG